MTSETTRPAGYSRKVAGIRQAWADPATRETVITEQSGDLGKRQRRSRGELIAAVDHTLDTGPESSPQALVSALLQNLDPADYDAILREALRVYIELRIHERQGESQLVQTETDKVRENRLRRMAGRQGLALKKSPRRDPHALGYGTYMLVDPATTGIVAKSLPDGYGLDLDDIERELTERAER